MQFQFTRAANGAVTWDAIIERPGDSVIGAHAHSFTDPGTVPVEVAVSSPLEPEDRLSVDATGKATRVRRVRASVFNVLANANAFADAVRDAVAMAGVIYDADLGDLAALLTHIAPVKHPVDSRWAVRVRPRFRWFATDRAQSLLVRNPTTPFEGEDIGNVFWRTNLATTTTRFNQMLAQMTAWEELDASWGL